MVNITLWPLDREMDPRVNSKVEEGDRPRVRRQKGPIPTLKEMVNNAVREAQASSSPRE